MLSFLPYVASAGALFGLSYAFESYNLFLAFSALRSYALASRYRLAIAAVVLFLGLVPFVIDLVR